RGQARAVPADVAGEQRQVDERADVVGGVVVLGDAEGPAQLGAVGGGVGVGQFADRFGGHAGDALGDVERPRLDRAGELLVAGGGPVDEGGVLQPGVDDLAGDGVGERDVGADVEPEPQVGPPGGAGAARVDGVHLRAVADAFEDVLEEDRVGVAGRRSPHDDDVGLFDLPVGGG